MPRKAPRERLLVVDDSPVNRTVIRDLLLGAGYRVATAADGPEAVRAAATDPAPDLVLMDLQMPGMDGIEAAEKIRRQAAAAGRSAPPVIALTAHATEQHRRQCLDAGMAGYVTKPARREVLMAAIGQALAPSGSAAGDPDSPQRPSPGAAEPDSPEPDWVGFFHEQTGRPDAEGLRAMAEMFLQEVPMRLRGLEKALTAGDPRAAERHAHSLKSCLRYVSSGPEVERLRRIEMAGKAERLEEASELLDATRPDVEAWCRRVRRWWETSGPSNPQR